MRPLLRRGIVLGALAGAAYAAWKVLGSRTPDTGGVRYEPQPFPSPPRPVPASVDPSPATPVAPDTTSAFVPPDVDGNCPLTHPIKGKLGTGIFHPPGAFAYERTRADRCYRDESAAEADGLRAAKR